ncbi:MAG: IPT/TIG domain-containing protein, partial [Bryobacteraceae bacterium]
GGHPWDLAGGQDALLLLFNHSAVPKYFNVKIGNGGVLWQPAYLLAAMETRAIRIRELIAGQVRDQHGEVLPRNLERGEIGWFTANPAEGAGRLMQINPVSQTVAADARVARNFSCSYAFVLCGASVAPAYTTFNDGQVSSQLEAVPAVCLSVTPTICSGQASSYGGLGYTYQWTASGPAQVYGPSTESIASFLGTGAGSGYAYVSIRAEDNGHHYYCQEIGFGILSVAPKINGAQPLSALPGQTVTLTGLGFGSSPAVKFGGTSVSPTSSSDTQIKFVIPVSASAGCEAGQLSYGTDVTYQVLDQAQGILQWPGTCHRSTSHPGHRDSSNHLPRHKRRMVAVNSWIRRWGPVSAHLPRRQTYASTLRRRSISLVPHLHSTLSRPTTRTD